MAKRLSKEESTLGASTGIALCISNLSLRDQLSSLAMTCNLEMTVHTETQENGLSRLHHLKEEKLESRKNVVHSLKDINTSTLKCQKQSGPKRFASSS